MWIMNTWLYGIYNQNTSTLKGLLVCSFAVYTINCFELQLRWTDNASNNLRRCWITYIQIEAEHIRQRREHCHKLWLLKFLKKRNIALIFYDLSCTTALQLLFCDNQEYFRKTFFSISWDIEAKFVFTFYKRLQQKNRYMIVEILSTELIVYAILNLLIYHL